MQTSGEISRQTSGDAPGRAPYVLVHAAWHGGWCWSRVAPLLRARGHEVFAPTLTGLGERAHLISRQIGLDTHVEDVVNALTYEGLTGAVLVGHSSSGAVIGAVAERVPERLRHLVYLDAFMPDDGQCLLDLMAPERRRAIERRVEEEGDGWRLPSLAPGPWDGLLRDAWGIAEEADRRWMLARLRPMPFRIFKDPVYRSSEAARRLPRTFIRCLRWPNPAFDRHAATARSGAGWRYQELDASHEPFITHPRELADLLLKAAA
jgi:pimeloyl-ACP methyl ester carboxylesterase